LTELREKNPTVNASRLQSALDDMRAKLKQNADVAQVKDLMNEMKELLLELDKQTAQSEQAAAAAQQAQSEQAAANAQRAQSGAYSSHAGGGSSGSSGYGGQDIIDAEVTSSN
jgi:allophanate hydrolase subunit 1